MVEDQTYSKRRLGIFGGTFDPPHIGHQILAAEAQNQLFLDKVFWVLTPDPPHKQLRRITPTQTRLEMVQAAIEDCPIFELSRVEINRQAPYYAVDTVRILKELHPRSEIIYLMGGDSLYDLPEWYKSQKLVASCHALGVMRRPGSDIDLGLLVRKIPNIRPKIRFIDAPMIEISASQIRKRIRSGGSFRYYIPPRVYQIIKERNLYRQH